MSILGTVIGGKYRVVRLLGDGGMGSVYEAFNEALGRRVAIKLLHPEMTRRSTLVERFKREAQVAAQIHSPHVVQVFDVDALSDNTIYIVMELLEGETLSAVLEREHSLAVGDCVEYALQILEALEAAHALGIIHRDLKPENVFVTFSAGKPVLKLIDFGIAKAKKEEKGLTMAGVIMGTAEYMAPEQVRAVEKVDARADIYALGVILYEMIAGRRPAEGDDARIVAIKVERGEVLPLIKAVPSVPPELAGLVHRAMAPRPELRFSSAAEMKIALSGIAESRGFRAPQNSIPPPSLGPQHELSGPRTQPLSALPSSALRNESGPPAAGDEGTGTLRGAPADTVLAMAREAHAHRVAQGHAAAAARGAAPPVHAYPQERKPELRQKGGGSALAMVGVGLLLIAGVSVSGYALHKASSSSKSSAATDTEDAGGLVADAGAEANADGSSLALLDAGGSFMPGLEPPEGGVTPPPGPAGPGGPRLPSDAGALGAPDAKGAKDAGGMSIPIPLLPDASIPIPTGLPFPLPGFFGRDR